MSSLTVHINQDLKNHLQKKLKIEGLTFTFIVNQALQAYNEGKIKFGLLSSDDEITASFDVSTETGKKACLKSFNNLCK